LDLEEYSLPLHIASVFVIFAFSSVGIYGALLLGAWNKSKPMVARVLQVCTQDIVLEVDENPKPLTLPLMVF
jgi:hypothetical protein